MHKTIVVLLACTLFAVRAHGKDAPWKEYANERFGFVLTLSWIL